MRYIGIIILLVLCLTLLSLTGCIINTVTPETTMGNLGNQENTEEPVIENTEEPVIENTEEPAEDNSQSSSTGYMKWPGLQMCLFPWWDTGICDTQVDACLDAGFTELRFNVIDYQGTDYCTMSKAAAIRAIAKGAEVIWGQGSADHTITAANWDNYRVAVLDLAQWAQDNGLFEFQIGNEEEYHVDNTTMTFDQLIANLKVLSTDVKAVFTRGNVSYTCGQLYIDRWVSAGKGDLDILASNIYQQTGSGLKPWKDYIDSLYAAFGATGTAITEFGPDATSLDNWSTDEAVQAEAITEMIDYIKASGITRAFYFCYGYRYEFGCLKSADGTYRLLWNQALLNTGPVKFVTVPTKTTTISLPDTIALMPKIIRYRRTLHQALVSRQPCNAVNNVVYFP